MTHPFPVTKRLAVIKARAVRCGLAVAHNGIIGPGEGDLSDTALFVRDVLAQIGRDCTSKEWLWRIERVAMGGRLAFLDDKGEITLLGRGWVLYQGIWYSNELWARRPSIGTGMLARTRRLDGRCVLHM